MERHPIENLMTTTMENIRDMVDVNTVVGDAIATSDGSTVIPVSRVAFGFVAGGGGIQVRETGRWRRRPLPAARARASACSPWASSLSAKARCALCRRRPTRPWIASSRWLPQLLAQIKAALKERKRPGAKAGPRPRAERAAASARIASDRRAPRVLNALSAGIVCPVRRGGPAAAGRGRSHAVFGRSASLGGGGPLGADPAHHGAQFVSQAPLSSAEEAEYIAPPRRGRPRRARRAHRAQPAPGGAHRQEISGPAVSTPTTWSPSAPSA